MYLNIWRFTNFMLLCYQIFKCSLNVSTQRPFSTSQFDAPNILNGEIDKSAPEFKVDRIYYRWNLNCLGKWSCNGTVSTAVTRSRVYRSPGSAYLTLVFTLPFKVAGPSPSKSIDNVEKCSPVSVLMLYWILELPSWSFRNLQATNYMERCVMNTVIII